MEKAGKEERDLAMQRNDVDEEGIPFITVYLDGGWSKRSYGHNYNAACGVVRLKFSKMKRIFYNILLCRV